MDGPSRRSLKRRSAPQWRRPFRAHSRRSVEGRVSPKRTFTSAGPGSGFRPRPRADVRDAEPADQHAVDIAVGLIDQEVNGVRAPLTHRLKLVACTPVFAGLIANSAHIFFKWLHDLPCFLVVFDHYFLGGRTGPDCGAMYQATRCFNPDSEPIRHKMDNKRANKGTPRLVLTARTAIRSVNRSP
jgi:hypothetical protein